MPTQATHRGRYVSALTDEVVTLDAIRAEYPHMLIPEGAELDDIGYGRLFETDPPAPVRGVHVREGAPLETEGGYVSTWLTVSFTPDELAALLEQERAEMAARIAERRWRAEVAGTTFMGWPVATDDRAQAKIGQTVTAFAAGLLPEGWVGWKFADGVFRTLTAAQFAQLAGAVTAHVQACFTHEAALLHALANGDAFDIEAGWPQTQGE